MTCVSCIGNRTTTWDWRIHHDCDDRSFFWVSGGQGTYKTDYDDISISLISLSTRSPMISLASNLTFKSNLHIFQKSIIPNNSAMIDLPVDKLSTSSTTWLEESSNRTKIVFSQRTVTSWEPHVETDSSLEITFHRPAILNWSQMSDFHSFWMTSFQKCYHGDRWKADCRFISHCLAFVIWQLPAYHPKQRLQHSLWNLKRSTLV